MTRVFVVETSYLCELYGLPGFSDQAFAERLQRRRAREDGARFHVPLSCLYQLCDHIADVPDGNRRRRLSFTVATDVRSSLREGIPWAISFPGGKHELPDVVSAFAANPGLLRLGLTNFDVVRVATDLKRKYGSSKGYRVHIWTKVQALKAYEPDSEPDPLV